MKNTLSIEIPFFPSYVIYKIMTNKNNIQFRLLKNKLIFYFALILFLKITTIAEKRIDKKEINEYSYK